MIDLRSTGAYCRTAGGNLELPDIQKPVVRWMAWSLNADNGGGGGTAVWDKARGLWDAAGIQNFPWMHCRSMADVERLIQVAEGKNAPAIGLNVEDVVGDKLSLKEVSGYVLDFWVNRYEKPVHMPTLPWVQNGQGWQWMSFAVAALEIFPDENPESQKPLVCMSHAFQEGLTKVTLMFKTALPSSTYDLSICHSLYTADDITPTANAWLAWQAPPCEKAMTPKPLWSVPCKLKRAKNDSGPRRASTIKHVVVHSTEGGTAKSVADFFATTAQASTQLVVDEKECYRMLPDLVIPWGAPGVNSNGLHIEQCGFAKWTREEWLAHDKTLRRSAAKTAKWAWQYGIPRRWVGPLGLKLGRAGFTRHSDASQAFPGSGHTDPGDGFPRDVYMGYVKTYYAEIAADRKR